MTNFRTLCVAVALVTAYCASAHGPGEELEELGLDRDALLTSEDTPGFQGLARELAQHGRYAFTAEALRVLHQSNDFYKAADVAERGGTPEELENAKVYRAAGALILERFLESADNVIAVDLGEGAARMDADQVTALPRDSGIVLLHVTTRTGVGTHGYFLEHDLETHQEHNDTLYVPFSPTGESWILLRMLKPPLETAAVRFQFQDVTDPSHQLAGVVRVVSEPMGALRFAVYDEDGLPCPAMVELKSLETEYIYRPAGAMEFSEQMDNIAGTPVHSHERPDAGQGIPYIAWIPGATWGMYYCVSEPFDMALPEGQWGVKIWRGIEYEPIQTVITVEAGETTTAEYHLKRWIDMAEKGWYSGDDHIHSRLMSDLDASRLLTFMEAADLDLGNVLIMGNNLRTYYPQRGFGPEFRVERDGRILVPGQEDPRYMNGHAIGLNITSLVRDESKYLYNDWVADTIHEQGGLYGFAHMVGGSFNIINDMTLLMPDDRSDFGEIHQSGILDTRLYYDFLNLGFELAAAGGSDVPYSHMMGEVRIFCYTGEDSLSADAWFDALRDGHNFVTNGPILELTADGAMPGDRIRVNEGQTLSVEASVLGASKGNAPEKLELVWLGNVIASKTSEDQTVQELTLTAEVPAGFGGWLALRAYSHDGQGAHTSPIYVERDGFRTWNVHKAEWLIDQCLETIENYRTELRRVVAQAEQDAFPPNQVYGPQLAAMAPGGFERANKAEAYYLELKKTLAAELTKRRP